MTIEALRKMEGPSMGTMASVNAARLDHPYRRADYFGALLPLRTCRARI